MHPTDDAPADVQAVVERSPRARAVEIWLVRHGQSVWNERGLAQGQAAHAPGLTGLGREQAAAAAASLEGLDISAVVSSDLLRAAETAGIVADALALDVELDPRLRERGLGVAEGQPARVLFGPDGGGGTAEGRVVDADAAPAGGESIRALVRRVGAYLDDLVRDRPGERLVLVTHGGVVRAALVASVGAGVDGAPWPLVRNAEPVHLRLGAAL